MRNRTAIVLAFIAGFLASCGSRAVVEPKQAEAQQGAAGGKWEHRFFPLSDHNLEISDMNKELAEIDAGGWEYSGYTPTHFGRVGFQYPLFKRLKK